MQELSSLSQITLFILLALIGLATFIWTLVHFDIIYS